MVKNETGFMRGFMVENVLTEEKELAAKWVDDNKKWISDLHHVLHKHLA